MNKNHNTPSVLANLRSVVPTRPLNHDDAKRVAELQANKLLDVLGLTEPYGEVPIELIASLPRIRIVHDASLPKSGATYWDGQSWIIAVNPADAMLASGSRSSTSTSTSSIMGRPGCSIAVIDQQVPLGRPSRSLTTSLAASSRHVACLSARGAKASRARGSSLNCLESVSRLFAFESHKFDS